MLFFSYWNWENENAHNIPRISIGGSLEQYPGMGSIVVGIVGGCRIGHTPVAPPEHVAQLVGKVLELISCEVAVIPQLVVSGTGDLFPVLQHVNTSRNQTEWDG